MYPGHWAKVSPEKPALINGATGDRVTYRELNDASNRLAQLLWERGLRRGDHIAIFMENHARFFDVIWAALRSGLYLTTINRYLTTDEAAYILDNCEAKALIASRYLADIAGGLPATSTRCKTWLMVDGTVAGFQDYEAAIAAYPARPLADEPSGAFMLYSSGTTGRPKGILRPLPPTKI
ncbi:MAG TPA: AMP-binding protein, partial [Pseudomonadales bacterium]